MVLDTPQVTKYKITENKAIKLKTDNKSSETEIVSRIIRLIKQYTNHKYVVLTNSGDLAIYAAMYYLSKAGYEQIIIPDQGGWLSYKKFPVQFNLKIIEVKTDKGVILIDELEKVCGLSNSNKTINSEKLKRKTALIITSFAGYYAEQPLKEISEICRKNNVLLIEDTNAVGDKIIKANKQITKTNKHRLCNGKLSDIIVCSFGKWKVVNNYQGGFISSNDKAVINDINSTKEIADKIKPVNLDYEKLFENLKTAHERLNFLIETCSQIKQELNEIGVNVFHKDKRGIVAITEYNDKVIDYCKKNKLEYTVCPRYIRVNEKAISIEVKRIER
ncbi:DegT/DnrJ/EryC1/StrS aminotransferase family protein [Candidatus Woesearchaeota archaeon]|nr:DegT/DnrJ/EryC1/StrS aminotransferase family protein [Candidatus Woesearchaeota archaeon]